MRIHPLAKLFPEMDETELAELAEDIGRNGLHEPLSLDASGQLLDGRNRLKACELAGVKPKFFTYSGDPAAFVISENVRRRHLDPGQASMLATLVLKEAGMLNGSSEKVFQSPSRGKSGTKGGGSTKRLTGQVAEAAGASAPTARKAVQLARENPKAAVDVAQGKMSLEAAVRETEAMKRQWRMMDELSGALQRRPDLAVRSTNAREKLMSAVLVSAPNDMADLVGALLPVDVSEVLAKVAKAERALARIKKELSTAYQRAGAWPI